MASEAPARPTKRLVEMIVLPRPSVASPPLLPRQPPENTLPMMMVELLPASLRTCTGWDESVGRSCGYAETLPITRLKYPTPSQNDAVPLFATELLVIVVEPRFVLMPYCGEATVVGAI